jgi:hypothetical protein
MMPKPSSLDDLNRATAGAAATRNDREIAQRTNAFASERASENDRPESPVVEL